jgi:CHASE2 domain-containing protein
MSGLTCGEEGHVTATTTRGDEQPAAGPTGALHREGRPVGGSAQPLRSELEAKGTALPAWRRGAGRAVVRFVALSALGAASLVISEVSLGLNDWSRAVINGVVKYAYPTTGQKETTVLLFREDDLRALGDSYPVPYERHAEVLEALAIHKPNAVFIDFAFIDRRPREQVDQLSKALCVLKDAVKDKVYLAVPALAELPATLEKFSECVTLVSAQMDSERGRSGVVTYSNGVLISRRFFATPAFAMAHDRLGRAPEHVESMEIIWGNGVPLLNKQWMSCDAEGPLRHLWDVVRGKPPSTELKCPYTTTLTVGHLLNSSGDPDVTAVLDGRAIFYGAAFGMASDRIRSPVYAELPGVYLHAMAYDNLRTFGRDYLRAEGPVVFAGGPVVITLSRLVDAVLLLATAGMLLLVDEPAMAARIRRRLSRSEPDTPRSFLGRHVFEVAVGLLGLLLFLLVDRALGLEAAILGVVLPGYLIYKALTGDLGFLATTTILVVASLVCLRDPLNIAPRNVIAYVLFFAAARRFIDRADKTAAAYFELRQTYPDVGAWPMNARALGALDTALALCARARRKEAPHATVVTPPR